MYEDLIAELNQNLAKALSKDDVLSLKLSYLGKKGKITSLLKSIRDLPNSEKKEFAAVVNKVKDSANIAIESKLEYFDNIEIDKKVQSETIDVTLPERNNKSGKIHPISFVLKEVIDIFQALGFVSQFNAEIEDSYYNFTALNIAEHHPARDMHDTFYLRDIDGLLRTHTSSVQIRTMQNNQPPVKIIAPGKTYRSDSDATHTPMFHQIEILYVDKEVNFANLKYCINEFLRRFFGINVQTRFRTSYFPFTEPSAEVDISYTKRDNQIIIGEGDEYMEILGCGMVHPHVLEECKIDTNKYQGFAIGIGIERLAMLKYGISDLRNFFNNDHDFLNNYGFSISKLLS